MGASNSKHFEDISPSDKIIAVIGQTGVGKSTFINTATGSEIPINHNLSPAAIDIHHTVCASIGRCGAARVVFVDVPAFDSVEDEKIVERKLKKWLKNLSSAKLRVFGILYLHRITDPKLADPPLRRLIQLKNLYQDSKQDFPSRIALATTMWGKVKLEVGGMREENLRAHLQGSQIVPQTMPIMRFERSPESAWSIVSTLVGDSGSFKN